jgi:hypothetical protein
MPQSTVKPMRTVKGNMPQKASTGGMVQSFMAGTTGQGVQPTTMQKMIDSGFLAKPTFSGQSPQELLSQKSFNKDTVKASPFARKLLRSMQQKVFGNLNDKTFDFDGTLVDNSEVLDDAGKIDIPGHTDLVRVESAMSRATLTPLGEGLVKKAQKDPGLLSNIQILTARPQSNDQIIADRLTALGLPVQKGQIKGVSTGSFSDDIPGLKSGALDTSRTLADDNIDNVRKVIADSKRALLYRGVENLDPDYATYLTAEYLGKNLRSKFIGDIPQLLLQQSGAEAAQQMGSLSTSYAEMVRALNSDGRTLIVPDSYNGKSTGKWAGKLGTVEAGKVLRDFSNADPYSIPKDIADRQAVKEYVTDQYKQYQATRTTQLQQKTSDVLSQKYQQLSKVTDSFVIFGFEPVGHKRLDMLDPWDLGIDAKGNNKIINPLVYEAGLPQKGAKALTSFRQREDDNLSRLASKLSKKKKNELVSIDDKMKERLGQGNVEGGALEKLAVSLGATPFLLPDQLTDVFRQNRPVDFSAISPEIFKIWDIPTIFKKTNTLYEAKRTIDSDSRSKAYEEFQNASMIRYGISPAVNQSKKAKVVKKFAGGLIQSFAGGGKPSRGVDIEAGVGPSPWAKPNTRPDYYSLEQSSGFGSREFNELVRYAKTNDFSLDEFQQYLSKRREQIKQKTGMILDPKSLQQFLLHGAIGTRPELTDKQKALADMLKSDRPDPKYNPDYDKKNLGGFIKSFNVGGYIPAMVSNGEAFIPPLEAQKIGYSTLNRMNQADRNGLGKFADLLAVLGYSKDQETALATVLAQLPCLLVVLS